MFLLAPQVLSVWLVASALLFAVLAGGTVAQVTGAILLCVALPFFINFGFDIVEKKALGYVQAPSFSWSPQTSIARLARLILYLSLIAAAVRLTPSAWQWLTMSLALAISPAVTAFIVFHEPVSRAFNPLRIWQFVSNMGISYLTLRLLTTSMLFVGLYVMRGEFDFMLTEGGLALGAAGFVLLLLLMCRLIGTLIHLRRDALGLTTHFSDEQRELAQQRERAAEIESEVQALSLVCRRDGFAAAWKLLEQSVKRHAYRDERAYLEALGDLTDRRLLYRFASGYIERHLSSEVSHLWHLLKDLFRESQGRFRFHSGSTLLAMAGTAESRQEKEIMLTMLADFETTFPGHPASREALLTAAELALDLGDDGEARLLLERVRALPGSVDGARLDRIRNQLAQQDQ